MKHILSIFIILLVLLILISTLGGSVRYNENFAGAAAPSVANAAAANRQLKAKVQNADLLLKQLRAKNAKAANAAMPKERFDDGQDMVLDMPSTTGLPPALMGAAASTTEEFEVSGFEAGDAYYALG